MSSSSSNHSKTAITARWAILVLTTGLYFYLAIHMRPRAYQENWNSAIQLLLGCLPNFIAVIGATSLINLVSKDNAIYKPTLQAGVAVLIYEVTGGFGRSTGIGITFDYWDILATVLGVLAAIPLERKLKGAP